MARRRFFVDSVRNGRAALAGDDARHLRQVLRAEVGQRYELSDNSRVYLGEIESLARDTVGFRIVEELPAPEPPVRVRLYLALIKFDRFEWAVEKATELGVEAIVPVTAERSEKGLERAAVRRVGRWRKIAREASQQARRARLPEIREPMRLAQALAAGEGRRYLLDEDPHGAAPLPAALAVGEPVSLLVGPEGGWTDTEGAAARAAGWAAVTLGPNILRTETAAAAALAVVIAANLSPPADARSVLPPSNDDPGSAEPRPSGSGTGY